MTEQPHDVSEHAQGWGVTVDEIVETERSLIAYGRRGERRVVLKVLKRPGDEWRSGEILDAFDGRGVARVYDHVPGALLMERLVPGNALVELSLGSRDDEVIDVLGDVIARMSSRESTAAWPTVQDWGKGFQRYSSGNAGVIPASLVSEAQHVFEELSRSQTNPRLLHGDLHHYNVLFDRERGWLAIDPKGVIGEIEYEIGAALRNPVERPDLFASAAVVERRLAGFAARLEIDAERALRWTFAQAVLAAIWCVEDGIDVNPRHPFIRLAEVMRPMLPR